MEDSGGSEQGSFSAGGSNRLAQAISGPRLSLEARKANICLGSCTPGLVCTDLCNLISWSGFSDVSMGDT
jgi:hypothetical protein